MATTPTRCRHPLGARQTASRSPNCAPDAENSRFRFSAGSARNRSCNSSRSTRFRRRLSVPLKSAAAGTPLRYAPRRRAGRTPFDPQRASSAEEPRLPGLPCLGDTGESRRTGYLQATSMVAPNGSWPTVDLPRRNERAEEQMAFGYFSRAGARAERNRSHSSTMRSVTFRQRGETRGFKRKSSPQSNGPEEAERIRRQALHAVARSTLQ